VDVWPFFSYRFAADFFATFDALFREVDDSEREAREGVRGGDGTYCSAPAFGTADSPANEVQAFYSHWTGYSSGLSFSGEDAFETTAAPNRDTRRAMEKENKKARDRARTDYVSALRSLVLYVKKMVRQTLSTLECPC
jgi:DnaJ family protein A protein 5